MLVRGVAISNCSASLQWTNGVVRIDSIRAVGSNSPLCIEGRGTIRPHSWDVSADLRIRASPADLAAAGLLGSNRLDVARHVVPLDAHLDVSGNLRDVNDMNVAFHMAGLPSTLPDALINVAHAQGQYSNGVMHVRQLRLTGSDPLACLPEALCTSIAGMGLHTVGPVHADLSLGPAVIPDIASSISGRVTCDAVGYRRGSLSRVAFAFQRNAENVEITDATATLKANGWTRSVTGRGVFGLNGAYAIHLSSDAEPGILATLLPGNMAPLVASLDVSGISRTEVELHAMGPRATNAIVRGTIHATDVARHGAPADLIHAAFAWTNRTIHVYDVAVVRQDGQVTGHGVYNLSDGRLSMDVRSTAPPAAIARFVGPGLERVLAPYRFEGPATIECKGTIGLRGNPAGDLRLHVEANQVGWRWFLADHAVLDLAMGEQATIVQDLDAHWCGGDVSGSLRFDKAVQSNGTGRCSIDLSVSGANLASVVDIFRDFDDRKAYEGMLSGQIALAGDTGPGFLQTATGSGRIDIQDGYILGLPLFGGLSKYLSLLLPGIGYASQRDLRGSFDVREGRLETSDARLLGNLISIQGKGSYAFSNDLKFRVQAQFLKEGLTATVTRLVTSPLTKALEFELTGTTDEPRWRPVNTPDRLLKFFTEKLGGALPLERNQNGGTAHRPDIKP